MRKRTARITFVALLVTPLPAIAHTGGALDLDGCHADHRTGSYHCHRGDASGYTFESKAAMKEAVRTGDFPDKTVDSEGFFSKLWPFGNKHEQETAPDDEEATSDQSAEGTDSSAGTDPDPSAPVTAPLSPQQEEAAQRLKVLKGLYEMGLITEEEYEAKRQAILGEL